MTNINENDIKQLNSLLRGELSAVETYQQCIENVSDQVLVSQLTALQTSHRARSILLRERIVTLGGQPDQTSGLWGSVAKALEGTAGVFGTAAAVSILEEGEDHGKADYEDKLQNLSASGRSFIETVIYPEQRKSHDVLSAIQASRSR
jgi:uncharacterized protein (TIGR02284 family)